MEHRSVIGVDRAPLNSGARPRRDQTHDHHLGPPPRLTDLGIAAAEPAPCMPAYDALKARMKDEAHETDTRSQVFSQILMEAFSALRHLRRPSLRWLHGCMRDSNAPPVGRPIAIGDGIRPAGGGFFAFLGTSCRRGMISFWSLEEAM